MLIVSSAGESLLVLFTLQFPPWHHERSRTGRRPGHTHEQVTLQAPLSYSKTHVVYCKVTECMK